MEEVVSPNNMVCINPSDKRRKETKEEVLTEFKSVAEAIDSVKKLTGILEILCKKHKVTPCDIKENARQLASATRTLIRTEGLREKAELERRSRLKEQDATMSEALRPQDIQDGQRRTEDEEICKENREGPLLRMQ